MQSLSSADKALQRKLHVMNAQDMDLQTNLRESAARIQRLVQLPAQPAMNGLLADASLGGNILLLALFVWMWRRQNHHREHMENLAGAF